MAYFGSTVPFRDAQLRPARCTIFTQREWNNFIDRLDDTNADLQRAKHFATEKQQLKELSKNLRKQWTDTQEAVRQRRLLAVSRLREERGAEMDRMVEEQKQIALNEAKRIQVLADKKQFMERDRVKEFNTALLEAETVRERNIQVQINADWRKRLKDQDDAEIKAECDKAKREAEEMLTKEREIRRKRREAYAGEWSNHLNKLEERKKRLKARRKELADISTAALLAGGDLARQQREAQESYEKRRALGRQMRKDFDEQIAQKEAIERQQIEDDKARREYELAYYKNKYDMFVEAKRYADELAEKTDTARARICAELAQIKTDRDAKEKARIESNIASKEAREDAANTGKAERQRAANEAAMAFREAKLQQAAAEAQEELDRKNALRKKLDEEFASFQKETQDKRDKRKRTAQEENAFNAIMLARKVAMEAAEKLDGFAKIDDAKQRDQEEEFLRYAGDAVRRYEGMDDPSAYPMYRNLRRNPPLRIPLDEASRIFHEARRGKTSKSVDGEEKGATNDNEEQVFPTSKRKTRGETQTTFDAAGRCGLVWIPDYKDMLLKNNNKNTEIATT